MTPVQIADDAISLFLEYRDRHGQSEGQARVSALNEIAEGEQTIHEPGQDGQARLAPIREVWEKYKEHDTRFQNAVLTYGYNDSDVRDVFHDCWQAIRKVIMEEQP